MIRAVQANLSRLFLVAAFLLPSASALADLQAGKNAFKNKDYSAALKEFKPLAESGNMEAQFYTGLIYDINEGLSQDYRQSIAHVDQAVTWYRKAAEQGFAPAQVNLGIILETGGRVERNYLEAASWYRKAASQNNAAAQFNLGLMYYAGRGDDIVSDYKEAAIWFRKAADQGDAAAQVALGRMYEYGQALPTDYVQAYKLYLQADASGNESAKSNIDSVEVKMTPEQIQEARNQVKKTVARK